MKLITFLLIFIPVFVQSQTKDDIINQIIKINRLQSAMGGLVVYIDITELTASEIAEMNKTRWKQIYPKASLAPGS